MSLFRALPYGKTIFEARDFVNSLENLGVRPVARQTELQTINRQDLPCICLPNDGKPKLITEIAGEVLRGIEAYNGQAIELKRDKSSASILRAEPDPGFGDRTYPTSLWETIRDLGETIAPLLAISLFINLLALTGPLLVMTVYDTVIPSNTTGLVLSFGGIVAVLLTSDFVLRAMRADVLAKIGTAAERRLSLALFTKLISLPLAQITRSTTHNQMARIRQFESVRDVFSGALIVNLMDFPFVLIFLAVVFWIAPPIGALLVAAILLLLTASILSYPRQKELSTQAGVATNDLAALQYEIAEHARTLSHFGLSDVYLNRSEKLSEQAAEANLRSKTFTALTQNLGQTLVALATLASIAFAALLAMQGALSFGALVAVATLAGRILGPVNTMGNNVLRIKSLIGSSRQITNVLKMDTELMRRNARSRLKTLDGAIAAKGAFVKFEAASEPSLAGVSFEIAPRSLVVLAGKSGAGKSTLMKSLCKLHHPASGSFSINGINTKQIMVDDLRNAISMNIQDDFMFNISLRENLILGNPVVDDARLLELFDALGAKTDLRHFYRGLDTDLSKVAKANLSANIVGTMSIVRCLAKPSSVYMLDDPFTGMTSRRITTIWAHLKEVSKIATVVVVSHHLDHLSQADQILLLERGRIALNDAGDNIGRKVHQMMQMGAGPKERRLQ
ncbi:peptidase domain-containing ABC transporter [Actibacterium sp. 188UL27-1]|uniref:peptidase domain-containing ABC transporter n=1 Tax=Actibacterium sp. 188UL27-1 TaxID=2786961 RepID=UPI001ECA53F2|nr:ATP-binding cassette domain-containing protein [Actibacterium sp. 188UL27-1]MBM7068662.1 ATP-binding cassette domain-containing protein [Actibacterium sp. 188UL27-1]